MEGRWKDGCGSEDWFIEFLGVVCGVGGCRLWGECGRRREGFLGIRCY